MNRQQLVDKVAKDTKLSKQASEKVIIALVNNIKQEVQKGSSVKIVGFGTFTKAKYKARNGRNPQTGEAIKIPKHSRPKFKPHDSFTAQVK